jgi:hypothetical protein
MVKQVKPTVKYECEVCNKGYATEKAALKCEQKHAADKLKEEQQQAERNKLWNALIDIRCTSRSFKELEERARTALREHYGKDFVFELGVGDYARVVITYVVKGVMNGDYYYDSSWKQLNTSNILRDLGFKTGCGGGNGKTYSWQAYCEPLSTFPAIYKATNERNVLVDIARKELSAVVDRYNAALKADGEYSMLQREADTLNERIKELTEKLLETREAANLIKDSLYRPAYNAECSAIIQALPTDGKEFCKDPVRPYF